MCTQAYVVESRCVWRFIYIYISVSASLMPDYSLPDRSHTSPYSVLVYPASPAILLPLVAECGRAIKSAAFLSRTIHSDGLFCFGLFP